MEIRGNSMHMVRGDDDSFTLRLRNRRTKEPILFYDGDTVYFTVKKSTKDEEIEIQKIITFFEDGEAVVEIDSADTREMKYGKYVYDIQLTDRHNKITTLRKYSPFILEGEVTYE